jgi:hypothetical protein
MVVVIEDINLIQDVIAVRSCHRYARQSSVQLFLGEDWNTSIDHDVAKTNRAAEYRSFCTQPPLITFTSLEHKAFTSLEHERTLTDSKYKAIMQISLGVLDEQSDTTRLIC